MLYFHCVCVFLTTFLNCIRFDWPSFNYVVFITPPTCCYLNDPIPNNQILIVDGNKHPFCVFPSRQEGNKRSEKIIKYRANTAECRMNTGGASTARWGHVSHTPGTMCICSLIPDAHRHVCFHAWAHTHIREQTPGSGLWEIWYCGSPQGAERGHL